MIKPTVGRVVLFEQTTAGVFPGSESTRAAIVAHVHDDRCVNLMVIDANGNTLGRTSVPLVQPGEDCPATMHCRWMDYQIGQAAKTHELADRLEREKNREHK